MKDYANKALSNEFARILVSEDFVTRNKLVLATPEVIKERFDKKSQEIMNFEPEILINYLPFDIARTLLKDEYVAKVDSGEEKYEVIDDIFEATQDFLDYMVFAWGKAMDQRGISAGRSINKLGAYLTILSRPDLADMINDDNLYNPYGAPALIAVCEAMGIDIPQELRAFADDKIIEGEEQ